MIWPNLWTIPLDFPDLALRHAVLASSESADLVGAGQPDLPQLCHVGVLPAMVDIGLSDCGSTNVAI